MKVKLILASIYYILVGVLCLIISIAYALALPYNLSVKFEVAKYGITQTANLGLIDEILLKRLGGAQNGPIEPFMASKADFIYKISKVKDWKITLIPGETLEIFFQNVASDYNLSVDKLKLAYFAKTTVPDGVLRPETYFVKRDSTEQGIIDRLYALSQNENERLSIKLLGSFNQNYWYKVVLPKASIIQKEAINASEAPIISSVIDNRLKIGMPLQMDGALNYGEYSHKKVTAERIRSDSSYYNTYKFRGLPPYPVCSVSTTAIEAAIFPSKTDYLYFVKNSNGVHSFNKDYKAHVQEIQSVKNSNIKR